MSLDKFSTNSKFDVIHYYTSIMERFGSHPLSYDVQIVETNNRYGFPDYVVTSPAFGMNSNFSAIEKMILQIDIPLLKVIEFSKTIEKEITYGIHTDVSFIYDEITEDNVTKIKEIIKKDLKTNQII